MHGFLARFLSNKVQTENRPARPRKSSTRLEVEELTPRVLPSATWLGMHGGHLVGHLGHAVGSGFHHSDGSESDSSTGSHAGDTHHGDGCASRANLAASLTDSGGATGQALFNATTGTLNVHVSGATADSSLDVTVDGMSVGSLTTDASGNGHSKFSNVTVNPGSAITVGDLSGTFSQVTLTAALSGSTDASGSAVFNSLENVLHVSISGAAADTTYNVSVNGVVLGQLTTNASGAAKLVVSPSGVTIQSGSTVSIADTAGDAAILQGTFA